MTWQVVASKATGTSHLKRDVGCQDAVDFRIVRDCILGAVADGAGSAKRSEIGATLAVQTTLDLLQRQTVLQSKPTDKQLRQCCNEILETVRAALDEYAKKHDLSPKDLACTLLVFVVAPEWFAAMQIGDGLIVIRTAAEYELVFSPYKGNFFNETIFVTSSQAQEKMQITLQEKPIRFLFASTDGLENPSLVRAENHRPLAGFFKPFEQLLSQSETKHCQQEIDQLLSSDRLNPYTDDDKSLIACVRRPTPPAALQIQDFFGQMMPVDLIPGVAITAWIKTPIATLNPELNTVPLAPATPFYFSIEGTTIAGHLPAGTYVYGNPQPFDELHTWVQVALMLN